MIDQPLYALSAASDGEMDMMDFTRVLMTQTEPLTLDFIRELATDALGHPPESLDGEVTGKEA